MSDLSEQQQVQRMWNRPEGASFEDWMNSRVARFPTRRYDWDTLKFQADFDPKYRRAQMRYLGTGGTGATVDTSTMSVERFAFSITIIPTGHEGPSRLHADVEEVFFTTRGEPKLMLEKDGGRYETILTDRDPVSVPPSVYHEEINTDDENTLICVMLGTKKLITPTYPLEHPLTKIRR